MIGSHECEHEHQQVRARKVRGGSIQYVTQCLACGKPTSQALPKSVWANKAMPFDEELHKRGEQANFENYAQQKAREKAEFDKKYSQYLLTPEWRSKRKAVMLRAQGICEGCRNANATQVHHLHYRRVFRELLFDLVAICDACHEACHADSDEQ